MEAVSYDVRTLEDPAKYDRLVELGLPAVWWELQGPLGGLHLLNEVRVPYFEQALGGFFRLVLEGAPELPHFGEQGIEHDAAIRRQPRRRL